MRTHAPIAPSAGYSAPGRPLERGFYQRTDVVRVARELLGKMLVTRIDGVTTAGFITETEAYAGVHDRASHAFGGRRSARNRSMYAAGGTAYVFLCYGIHHLFNVVTNAKDVPDAVLIRAIAPRIGIGAMGVRRAAQGTPNTGGPGTLAQALGITRQLDGCDLSGPAVWIEDHGVHLPSAFIRKGPRVGVDYAGDDALLPYRFRIAPDLVASLP